MPDDMPVTDILLTGALREIARITSAEIAITIARHWGGRRLYLPQQSNLGPDHKIVKLIGRRAALIICKHFGDGQISIPGAASYLRWYDARKLRRKGKSIAQISKALKITERQVYKLLSGFDCPDANVSKLEDDHDEVCPACNRRARRRRDSVGDDRQLRLEI